MSHKLRAIGLACAGALILAGCSFTRDQPVQTVIVSVPTNTLAPIVSFTPKFTATQVPTNTPIPSVTPTPSNTIPPEPPTLTPTATATASVFGTVNFTSPAANLRAGPGQNFAILTGIKAGTRIIVLGMNSDKDWYNVRLEDGTREGWLNATLVTVPNPDEVAVLSTEDFDRMTKAASLPTNTPGGPTSAAPRKAGVKRPTDVLAYCDNKVNGEPRKIFNVGASVTIYWSWFAKTPEQLADHINYAEYVITFDGTELKDWRNFKSDVVKNADGNYYVFWYVPVGTPAVGEHKIDFKLTWKQAITDGYAKFGPGTENALDSSTCGFTVK